MNRKNRLRQVCHLLQDVEHEQHFVLGCPAYSHTRNKHVNFSQPIGVFQPVATCIVLAS